MTLEERLQEKFDAIGVPKSLSPLRAEVWKAAVRASIRAVNTALNEHQKDKGDHDEP